MVSFGWKAAPEQYSPENLLEHTILAEKAGMDSVWVSDHFLPWADTGAHCAFAWVWLASVAERTKSMIVGTGVTAPILRYHPAIVAQAFATLGRLYPGRVRLGLATGEPMNEMPLGYDWPSSKERIDRLEEAVKIIKMLWEQDWVTHQGEYYRLRNAKLYTKPKRPIPIYMAAFTPEVAGLVGKYADGYYTFLGKPVDYFRETLFPAVKKGASQAGKDFDKMGSSIEMLFSYDEDKDKALASARFWKATLLPVFTKHAVYDPREIEENGRKVGDEAMEKTWVITTDPHDIIKRATECLRAGFKQVVFMSSSPDQHQAIGMLAKEVVPHLRQDFAR
jgi:coenzyme F420-dependent glucose-6-phosphate dehydrogenase